MAIIVVSGCQRAEQTSFVVDESKLPPLPPQELVRIPAGEFIMGSDRVDSDNQWRQYGYPQPFFVDEHPRRKVTLPEYFIDKYETGNAAYLRFTLATHRANPRMLLEQVAQLGAEWGAQPVANISWQFARDFCAWSGKRLPTEAEWEKAARGTDGREYPWGDAWDKERLNAGDARWTQNLAPVTAYANGASPYGVLNMAGNVSEWVEDGYQAYPGGAFRSTFYGTTHRVVRGGGWGGVGHYTLSLFYRAAYRDYEVPERAFNDIGVRCAMDPAS